MTHMRQWTWSGLWLSVACMSIGGCGGRGSSLLMERQARGTLSGETEIAKAVGWVITPVTQTKTQSGVDVEVTWASPQFLREFFSRPQIFGKYAGLNPYFPEQLVFYVKVTNHSGDKIQLDPTACVLVDDRGNQYRALNIDYTTTLAESKTPITTMTRGVLQEARPGYFGFSLPVGQMFVGEKPQRRYALLILATLQAGFLYDGVSYDGLIAYWSPHEQAHKLRLFLSSLKMDFTAAGQPGSDLDFVFEMEAVHSHSAPPAPR